MSTENNLRLTPAKPAVTTQYGVILPNVGPLAHIDALATIALRAEELGYDGIFLSDHHVVVPDGLRSAYPYRSDGRFPLIAADRVLEPMVARPTWPPRPNASVWGSAYWCCPTSIPR